MLRNVTETGNALAFVFVRCAGAFGAPACGRVVVRQVGEPRGACPDCGSPLSPDEATSNDEPRGRPP